MLKVTERERLRDCLLLIRSAQDILTGVREEEVPDLTGIESCMRDADKTLSQLLSA